MSILSRSIYTIFFTVGSRNSTKISNFKNKKMMTNELSSFDEFNGISSCLDNTIRFLSQQKMLYFCHDVDIRKVDFYSRSWKKFIIFVRKCYSLGRISILQYQQSYFSINKLKQQIKEGPKSYFWTQTTPKMALNL
jgi:hypothetical protein